MNYNPFYTQLINRVSPLRPLNFTDLNLKKIELPYQVDIDEDTDEREVYINLEYIDFVNTTISSSEFRETRFKNLRFWGKSYFHDSHFGRCKFFSTDIVGWFNNIYSHCDFNDCDMDFNSYNHEKRNLFSDCYFKNCKLYVSDFTEFENCKFENCKLNKVNKKNTQTQNELNFINCEIDQLEFNQKELIDLHFINCKIIQRFVYLQNKTISKCSFIGIDLNIKYCQGELINFNHSTLKIEESSFLVCNFSNSKMQNGINSILTKGTFYNAEIGELVNCKLNDSIFFRADLTRARIINCDIINTDFTDIILNSNISANSFIDNLFFIQISTNIIGFQKITYCPEINRVFMKFETEHYIARLEKSKILNSFFRKYSNDFFNENGESSAQIYTLSIPLEELSFLVQNFYIDEEILKDSTVAIKILMRKTYRLDDYKISDIPNGHFKVIGKKLMNVISFLNSIND
jgi:uncharacterized protein YjbI with pentapeptide repeats